MRPHTPWPDHAAMEATAVTITPLEPVGRYWWLPLAAGVLSILVGLLALIYPGPTLQVFGLLFGIYLLIWGAVSSFRGISAGDGMPVAARIVLILVGLLALLAGLWLVVRPEESVVAIARAVGFWWVV